MLCSRARTALSARLDGEELPPGVTATRLEQHLAGCRDCRGFQAGAARLDEALAEAVRREAEPEEGRPELPEVTGPAGERRRTGGSGRQAG